ncbi:SRPBCC family protein [Terrabacter sp. NPDC080008]|uniref:SRPBCC family protein n=1 Tax=Terrabacter sp. NPDC080008 TaxID=3155176 RepID=UPI003450F2D3
MATFTVHLDSALAAREAWRRVLDLHAHSAVIPLTTVTGETMTADGLVPGSRFVARTAVGPVGFDDVMVVEAITQPGAEHPGTAWIQKEGKVVRGSIDLRVSPAGSGSTVDWSQEIGVRGVPRLLDPLVGRVAQLAYGTALRRLLAHRG